MAFRDDDLTIQRSGTDAESTGDTAALRAEITEARERMGDTIEQIGERLNPSNLKAQVKEDIREATIGRVETMAHHAAERVDETRRTITDTIRENPIPAAMVGIGLGWLLINGRRSNGDDYEYDGYSGYGQGSARFGAGAAGYGQQYRTGGYGSRGYASGYGSGAEAEGRLDDLRHKAEDAGEDLREKAAHLGENVREKASHLGEQISEGAHDVAERTQEIAGNVAHRAQDMYGNVAQTTRRQARRVEDSFYENPLLVGALTLTAGLAVGLAMPRTRRESQLMGEWRDDLVDRAKDFAADTKEKVQHVAERTYEEAKETAQEAAEDEGLTS